MARPRARSRSAVPHDRRDRPVPPHPWHKPHDRARVSAGPVARGEVDDRPQASRVVRVAGLDGACWPEPLQEAILRVAAGPEERLAEHWRALRPQLDLDDLW